MTMNVDGLVVSLVPLEGVVIHHPPGAPLPAGTHVAGGLDGRVIGGVVAVAFEVVAQVVGHVRLAGGDDEAASGVFEAVEVVG